MLCYELIGPASVRRRWPAASRLGRPLATYTVILLLLLMGGGFFWYFHGKGSAPVATPMSATPSPTAAAAAYANSIAVLPSEDMSAEKNQKYMADGIAEEPLNLLTQVPDLKVIARTSSFAFKGQIIDVTEIAKKLNVTHVLEGSVRTSGDRCESPRNWYAPPTAPTYGRTPMTARWTTSSRSRTRSPMPSSRS